MKINEKTVSGRRAGACRAFVAAAAFGIIAGMTMARAEESKVYMFPRTSIPVQLEPYSTVVYTLDGQRVQNLKGTVMLENKNGVKSFAMSPAGASFFAILLDKKGNTEGALYSTSRVAEKIAKFDHKKLGRPHMATFSPDARRLIVATDSAIVITDARTLRELDRITGSPIATPEMMRVSPNGYYLALGAGNDVAVYNLEEKTLRRKWDAGEKVNDIEFGPESNEMGVLTADGLLSLYGTRTFDLVKTIDDLGEGNRCDYNFDGKYMAVASTPENVVLVNLMRPSDREDLFMTGVTDLQFITDSQDNTILAAGEPYMVEAMRLPWLRPFYSRLVAEEVDQRMAEWMKMMPGESMEDYRERVNDESRARMRRLLEDEISTNLAGDLLAGATMTLGAYDRTNKVLAVNFDTMPTIYLPVAESDVASFGDGSQLRPVEVRYGLTPEDTFEIIYASFFNAADGKTYTYDNLERRALDYMAGDDDAVSLEIIQQQQMEEVRLQELRTKVVEEARHDNVISDHTDISVDSRVETDYDANGEKILNYVVNFTYTVDPEFSAVEDFGPGKYLVEESGAASSMLRIVKEALEGDFSQYVKNGGKLKINLTGTADATPIVRTIGYNGVYGELKDEPVYVDGTLSTLTVTSKDGVNENEQLALLRALGVKDYLEKNVERISDMRRDYNYHINVSKDKGSAFRRITAQFTFVDAF